MKIIMIGVFPHPITGLSLANKILADGLIEKQIKVKKVNMNLINNLENLDNQGNLNIKKSFNGINKIFFGIKDILFSKSDLVYLTPGQTLFGFLRFALFMIVSKLKKVPYVVHLHGYNLNNLIVKSHPLIGRVIIKLLKDSSGLILLGDSIKQEFTDLLPKEKIFICQNGVEEYLIPNKNEYRIRKKTSKIKLLYLSNLMESKGILDLLNSIEIIKSHNYDVSQEMAGEIEPKIKAIINNRIDDLKDNVKYHGVVSGERKKLLLQTNDILCLPSAHPLGEGQPLCILEAQINGLGIVATNLGGIKDIMVDGVNGYFCEGMNPESIAKSIIKTYENIEYISAANYNLSNNLYRQSDFVNRIIRIFYDVLGPEG